MHNLKKIETYFQMYREELDDWIPPDGWIQVDEFFLQELGLFGDPRASRSFLPDSSDLNSGDKKNPLLFFVDETQERLTLVNEKFVVWIVPGQTQSNPITYTIIAENKNNIPKPQMVLLSSGEYNSSILLLKIIERVLRDIQENEELEDLADNN